MLPEAVYSKVYVTGCDRSCMILQRELALGKLETATGGKYPATSARKNKGLRSKSFTHRKFQLDIPMQSP